jgi:hypothetical protein
MDFTKEYFLAPLTHQGSPPTESIINTSFSLASQIHVSRGTSHDCGLLLVKATTLIGGTNTVTYSQDHLKPSSVVDCLMA